MRPGAVAGAVRGGLGRRRRVQTVVIAAVLLVSTASAVLGLALVVDSNAPFDRAFASQRGAHIVASIDPSRVTPSALAATRGLAPVTAAAGPFAVAEISGTDFSNGYPAPVPLPPLSVAGRSSPDGSVDDVALQSGHWAQRPGQIVVDANGQGGFASLGDSITVTSAPGHPRLTVVGIATSASNSAGAWVAPAEIAALREPGQPPRAQMLYRFRDAGTAAAIAADEAAVTGALPAGRGDRRAVLPGGQGAADEQDRGVRAVRDRVRGHRPRDVGADRRERGQRRGRDRLSPDRGAQEHRLHAGAGGRGVHGPDRRARDGGMPGRPGAREPARCAVAQTDRDRVRSRVARRAGVGGRRGRRGDGRCWSGSRPCCRRSGRGG